MLPQLPPWVVLHIPHAATTIPDDVRSQFVPDAATLEAELALLTDHHVLELFADGERDASCVIAEHSRLVVDMERFADDAREPAAQHGFGAVYTRTSTGNPLRRSLRDDEHTALLRRHAAHHDRLHEVVAATLREHDRCLLLDCHTFPTQRLPFEVGDPRAGRPDVCIGTDALHTPPALRDALVAQLESAGWSTAVDTPFAGTMVPELLHGRKPRLAAVMLDVHRRIAEPTPTPELVERFRAAVRGAITSSLDASPSRRQNPIDPGLLQAYRETCFEVLEHHPMTLRIGEPCLALRALHHRHGTNRSAFLTACNPRSEPLSDDENDRRHARLREELEHRGLTCFEGRGRHPSNSWPPERSLLVLGIDRRAAHDLGARWDQNAIVWCGGDAVPDLILIADDDAAFTAVSPPALRSNAE